MEMGINFQYVHRISAIAAGTLDTLPHQGAQITLLGICKMTHKEAYWDIAVTQIISRLSHAESLLYWRPSAYS